MGVSFPIFAKLSDLILTRAQKLLRLRLSSAEPACMASRVASLNWLRVFEAAVRSESLARAAVPLNMSPAAMSQQVRALEEHLGRALFQRGAQSVMLTEAGRAYLPPVQQALGTLDRRQRRFLVRRGRRLFMCRRS